ncbi:MAG: SMC-Scp complex subunit ScpB [Planctomycetaceae bacterium]|jgi:segregation and condensation protein B|nr:SMC-Scp complex subunit ScpB [Planctomycetaceae bacterium]
MSIKKMDKNFFVSADNADSSDNSSDYDNVAASENAEEATIHGKFRDTATEMRNKLGAKYYVENAIDDEEEDATILSLESLREVFKSIKSGDVDQDSVAEVAATDDVLSDEYDNVTELSEKFDEDETVDEMAGEIDDDVDVDIDDEDDEVDEEFDLEQDEIEDQFVANSDDGEATAIVNPESIFEAMLFVGDLENKPLTAEYAAEKMRNVKPQEIEEAVKSLNNKYDLAETPYKIIEDGGGYRMILREEFESIQEKFYGKNRDVRLSQPAIDTLAIIAYKQPITADEIQALRKQPSGNLITQLIKRGLVKTEHEIHNKKKKISYRTTTRFLALFQLDSIDDLPVTEDFDFR